MCFVLVWLWERIFHLTAADEICPDLQHVAVFRQIHSRCKAVGLQEVLGTYFWPWLFMSCLKLGVFSCRIETLCKYANLHIIFYGKSNCFISVVSFHFSGVLNLLFQDSKSAFFSMLLLCFISFDQFYYIIIHIVSYFRFHITMFRII